MKKKLITSTLFLCALGSQSLLTSCATNQTKAEKAPKNDEMIIGDIGSANPKDRGARLDFLTKTITQKRAELLKAKKANRTASTEESQLEVEILDNEILLLEAEMYGLQEGMDLNPSEL
jgi:hypothetical protein